MHNVYDCSWEITMILILRQCVRYEMKIRTREKIFFEDVFIGAYSRGKYMTLEYFGTDPS